MPITKDGNEKKNQSELTANSGVRQGPPKFVQYRLSDEELSEAKKSIILPDDLINLVSGLAEVGYKFSVSRDNYGGGIQAFLTPGLDTDPNFGLTLTARAPDLLSASSILFWKHFKLFGTLWPHDNSERKGGGWG